MVKVFLKGGVWKNSEDEILKAAVMKYGKQQWARVASLLNRKTAKQCKARWHEWLDPSVRKVEWSRAEEEKLLHLAKLMPAQWKTIAPLIGRTAAQCQEHYEKLLDEAAGGGEAGNAELRNQAASLRPGQIDSHPETKPARPDPVDMDEDEIEMLQEARARLANTQGKKAKRKAREKMLNEAKRLADLQKRRELKQAGLLSSAASKKARRSRDIDLGVEIPFHKPAPAGFHDVSAEDAQAEHARARRLKEVDYKQINENQYRSRDREAKQAQKREEARLRRLEQSNMDYVVAQVSKANDPLATRKRGALELPAPTVTDTELKKLAKLTAAQQQQQDGGISAEGSAATQALLGDYSDRPLPTPMRTPMTGSIATQQSIRGQASQLRMLEQGQTPLLGGDDIIMDTSDGAPTAATPRLPSTSNETPMDRSAPGGQTPLAVAPRDQLGLNKRPHSEMRMGDDASVSASTFAMSTNSIREMAREERRAAKRARQELEAALAALPAPQFEYELAAPEEVEEENQMVLETVEEDSADRDAAERERMKKEADRLYEARSSVVKRPDLPRPEGIIPDFTEKAYSAAEQLIQDELLTLLRHDAHAFPVVPHTDNEAGKKKKKRRKMDMELPPETPIDVIPEESLDAAKTLLQAEFDSAFNEKVLTLVAKGKSQAEAETILSVANTRASQEGAAGLVYAETEEGKGWLAANNVEKVDLMRVELDTIQQMTAALRKKNDKTESKLSVKHGGYAKRAESLKHGTLHKFAEKVNSQIETDVFGNLRSHEVRGITRRIDNLREEIAKLEEDEAVAQKHYGDLVLEKKRLQLRK